MVQARNIRFTIQEVAVMLRDEERRVINWIWPNGGVVIGDRDSDLRRWTEDGTGRLTKGKSESFVSFDVCVVSDWNRKCLDCLACCKLEGADSRLIIAVIGCFAVNRRAITVGGIAGREIHTRRI